ncbi:MAG: monovalent cation/H(+) antiporter subunit G [Weeksellaceae bacterium]|nr:monovalent cation/H(+) antiporter subunit G [Weeksellaceae bacterium]
MIDLLIALLSTLGALFILFASIGLLRMPDFYLRLSVTVKASVLGAGLFLVCAAIMFPIVSVTTKVIAIIFFLIITAPIAAHMIGRAAYYTGVSMWKDTWVDQMQNYLYRNEKLHAEKKLKDEQQRRLDQRSTEVQDIIDSKKKE